MGLTYAELKVSVTAQAAQASRPPVCRLGMSDGRAEIDANVKTIRPEA